MKSILIQGLQVKTTVTIDEALYQKALDLAGPNIDKENIVQEALKTFVRVEAGKRLAALGSSNPTMADVPRQRVPAE
jgi:Arc/MetJ family transcription regulator